MADKSRYITHVESVKGMAQRQLVPPVVRVADDDADADDDIDLRLELDDDEDFAIVKGDYTSGTR